MINKHLSMLGYQVKDSVTQCKGVVTSITFDLYGCIQALVHPGWDKEKGEMFSSQWFDVNRLEIVSEKPVMNQPDYDNQNVSNGDKGPASKPFYKA